MVKDHKTFAGKRFNAESSHGTKSAATRKAKTKRKQGWQVRTSKDKDVKAKKGKHRVWVRRPKSFGKKKKKK